MTPAGLPSPASAAAAALLRAFVDLGVTEFVVSPGSRSQALALAGAALDDAGLARVHVRIDERVGGFLALGLALETGLPAVVITTSGTATANLHPAVLEAHHSNVPMIVLTADRPAELHGIRANQTTDQNGLYGSAIRLAIDVAAPVGAPEEADAMARLAASAVAAATDEHVPGPVHVNLAYREPLSGTIVTSTDADIEDPEGPEDETSPVPELPSHVPELVDGHTSPVPELVDGHTSPVPEPVEGRRTPFPGRPALVLERGPRTLVVAGHGAGPDAEALAAVGGWPLIAEVSSGSRFGRNVVVAYRELLRDDEYRAAVERVIVFGHPTLSREVPMLLQTPGVETVIVAPTGAEVYNPGRLADHIASSVTVADGPSDRSWLGAWVVGSRELVPDLSPAAPDLEGLHSKTPSTRLASVRAELDAVREPVTRELLVDAVWRATWPHDRLLFGASRLIRVADGLVHGRKIPVHANRGLAGIDGTVATATGIALASQAAGATGVTRVLLGDLTLLHDVGALLLDGSERPRLQLVVGNDGGGTIFDSLEVASSAPEAAFDRVQYTPQTVDFAALAAAYGWTYVRAATRGELDQAFTTPVSGPVLVEVPLPRR
ncbi:2-succinyl-5-enolpyruvyl-6-hydroxy-3-cyclohexene-1-carboxylic-acid synthase [Plantibacter sp. YIM 135249]|uniref:2-succinyl-5-enolpyruvyl-6-hydroxy-3- cyclohexene-1-carboxylic-acid synthase n=1 Tax=Plantibacter sp. YIM 135249 TaxID=3423918 RepID=UPI003D32E515